MASDVTYTLLYYITLFPHTEAVIGFVNTDLSISEDGGELEFKIAVLQGNLRITVPVNFATADGSASGRSLQF